MYCVCACVLTVTCCPGLCVRSPLIADTNVRAHDIHIQHGWLVQAGTMTGQHEKLEVSFVNDLDTDIDLHWIAHSGEHQMFETIKKNSIYIVNTYVGHRYATHALNGGPIRGDAIYS